MMRIIDTPEIFQLPLPLSHPKYGQIVRHCDHCATDLPRVALLATVHTTPVTVCDRECLAQLTHTWAPPVRRHSLVAACLVALACLVVL